MILLAISVLAIVLLVVWGVGFSVDHDLWEKVKRMNERL